MVTLEDIKSLIKEGYATGGHGQFTVDTSRTAQRITDEDTPMALIIIKALNGNNDRLYIGFDAEMKQNGYVLNAKEEREIRIDNLNKVWFDVDNDGEGFSYITLV